MRTEPSQQCQFVLSLTSTCDYLSFPPLIKYVNSSLHSLFFFLYFTSFLYRLDECQVDTQRPVTPSISPVFPFNTEPKSPQRQISPGPTSNFYWSMCVLMLTHTYVHVFTLELNLLTHPSDTHIHTQTDTWWYAYKNKCAHRYKKIYYMGYQVCYAKVKWVWTTVHKIYHDPQTHTHTHIQTHVCRYGFQEQIVDSCVWWHPAVRQICCFFQTRMIRGGKAAHCVVSILFV